MNWFERYGIPGMYFIILTLVWIYVIYPCLINSIKKEIIIALIALAVLPIGYILTNIQNLLYYRCDHLSVHKAAKYKFKETSLKEDEETLEAISLLKVVVRENNKFERFKFAMEWCRKRVDVIVISSTILNATILSFFIAVACYLISLFFPSFFFMAYPQVSWAGVIIILMISLCVVFIMCRIRRRLNRQVKLIVYAVFYKK